MKVLGIDLGTSTTEAGLFQNGKVEMIRDENGKTIIPSAVGLDAEGNWVIGERARAQQLLFPDRTAIEVKRKTGTNEIVNLGESGYFPYELQAKLLGYIKELAEKQLGESVDRAVISVPAYFNNEQRQETIQAGEAAGFTVERILNEPTAASLSYGLEHMEEESHVLVYDLGGGTFDVTLLEMFDGVLEVRASAGDNQLGGKDFDERLMDFFFDTFKKKRGKDIRGEKYAQVKVKEEAERVKIALSTEEKVQAILPALATVGGRPAGLDVTVTRTQFEEMTRDLVERTHDPISRVLSDADLDEEDIDRIILVGGSTRMPRIQADIEEFLGIAPEPAVHPDLAVSEGAAIMGGIISGEIDPAESLVMTDVSAFSLGIEVLDGYLTGTTMSTIIPRNTTIPVTRREQYVTSSNGQTVARVNVLQGESRIVEHNLSLGTFELSGIPPRPARQEKLDVYFSYDLNGVLNVRAVVVSTGKDASIRIDMSKGKTKAVDVSAWKDAPGAKEYRTAVRAGERAVKQDLLGRDQKEAMEAALQRLKEALVLNRMQEAKAAEEEILTLLEGIEDVR